MPPTPTVPASIALSRRTRLSLPGLGSLFGVSAWESSRSGSGRGPKAPVGSLWVPSEYLYSGRSPGRIAFEALLPLRVSRVPPGHCCPGRFPFRVPSNGIAAFDWFPPASFQSIAAPSGPRVPIAYRDIAVPIGSRFAVPSPEAPVPLDTFRESGFGIGRSLCLALLPSGTLPPASLCFDPEGSPPPSRWQCP